MKNAESYTYYLEELRHNVAVLEQLLNPAEATRYPYLALRLRKTRKYRVKRNVKKYRETSLGGRLMNLLEYFIQYEPGKEQKRFVSYDDEHGRGYEVPCSYSYMIRLYGGTKETWWRNINFLCVLGLIYRHKPDTDRERNTPAQEWSVKRAETIFDEVNKGRGADEKKMVIYPDSWYSFPRYTESILKEADRRAEALKAIGTGRINKDLVRDVLGGSVANVAFGNGFPMGTRTAKQRELLCEVLRERIAERGYCYPSELIAEAARRGNYWTRQVEQTYTHYRDVLLSEQGCVYRATGKADRERWGIAGRTWIITRTRAEEQAGSV